MELCIEGFDSQYALINNKHMNIEEYLKNKTDLESSKDNILKMKKEQKVQMS